MEGLIMSMVDHSRLSFEELAEILSHGEEALLEMTPYERNRHPSSYNTVSEKCYPWYKVLICLSKLSASSYTRACKFDWDYDLNLKALAKLWIQQGGRCAATNIIMSSESGYWDDKNPYKISIDRVDNDQGYVMSNVRLLTHWANNAKSTWDHSIFEEFVKSSNSLLESK